MTSFQVLSKAEMVLSLLTYAGDPARRNGLRRVPAAVFHGLRLCRVQMDHEGVPVGRCELIDAAYSASLHSCDLKRVCSTILLFTDMLLHKFAGNRLGHGQELGAQLKCSD